jgi:transcriptional regulator with GAF, ATPase, and Fis domain
MDRSALQSAYEIIGKSPAFLQVLDRLKLVAPTDIAVLIEGESGSGKEKIAEAVHGLSLRNKAPFIMVNCGAIPEGLMEIELFGYEKGYMGALEGRAGYFEAANGGTVLLDEIGEMPAAVQIRLLRVLDTGDFSRVGSAEMRKPMCVSFLPRIKIWRKKCVTAVFGKIYTTD